MVLELRLGEEQLHLEVAGEAGRHELDEPGRVGGRAGAAVQEGLLVQASQQEVAHVAWVATARAHSTRVGKDDGAAVLARLVDQEEAAHAQGARGQEGRRGLAPPVEDEPGDLEAGHHHEEPIGPLRPVLVLLHVGRHSRDGLGVAARGLPGLDRDVDGRRTEK